MSDNKLRAEVVALASRAAIADGYCELRAANDGGRTMSQAERDELLAKAVARERVELDLEIVAYEQGRRDAKGEVQKNRNKVRFRPGLMTRLGRTGRGTPFLSDHRQGDVSARSGTVIASETTKLTEDGHYQIRQTVRLTEPAAVERALRGLMSTVSIGWNPTGPITCSACDTEVLTKCWHAPGDKITTDDGLTHEVEWEFTDAELIETSEVSVPGVPSAQIEGIRAAMSLALKTGSAPVEEPKHMKNVSVKLGLAASAGEDEILKSVETLIRERDTVTAKLAIAEAEQSRLQADVEVFRAEQQKVAQDAFIRGAFDEGKLSALDEVPWRHMFATNPTEAVAMLAARPKGCATPVGLPRQSAAAAPAIEVHDRTHATLASAGIDPIQAEKFAAKFGAKNPRAALALVTGKDA